MNEVDVVKIAGTNAPVASSHVSRQEYGRLLIIRAAFIFTLIAIVPLSWTYLKNIFAINWSRFNYTDVDLISNYYPWFVDDIGLGTDYPGLILAITISIVGAAIWTWRSTGTDTDKLYYWLQVIVRYKLAGVMLYFAFVKLFPVQMPFPSISQMNTPVGDYTPGRLFWIATGAAPVYEVFSGAVELVAALLLLWRRTAAAGAFLLTIIMVQLVAVNVGYDAGIQVKAILVLLLTIILLADNVGKLWNFFLLNRPEKLTITPAPVLLNNWQRRTRIILKTAFILLFVIFRGYSVGHSFFSGKSYKLPENKGLPEAKGIYHVSGFTHNNREIPFSPLDSLRWQNVAFERWNTISIKVYSPLTLSVTNGVRKTEVHSNGGRQYYAYEADTTARVLKLYNRADTTRKWTFEYDRKGNDTLVLHGVNERSDSVAAVLTRIERTYPLIEGRDLTEPYLPY